MSRSTRDAKRLRKGGAATRGRRRDARRHPVGAAHLRVGVEHDQQEEARGAKHHVDGALEHGFRRDDESSPRLHHALSIDWCFASKILFLPQRKKFIAPAHTAASRVVSPPGGLGHLRRRRRGKHADGVHGLRQVRQARGLRGRQRRGGVAPDGGGEEGEAGEEARRAHPARARRVQGHRREAQGRGEAAAAPRGRRGARLRRVRARARFVRGIGIGRSRKTRAAAAGRAGTRRRRRRRTGPRGGSTR